MRTATHVLLAGAELPAAPFVVTVIATPEMVTVDDAVSVSVPGVLEFAVNVHCSFTGFVAVAGAIAIFASTHRFVAGPELSPLPFVDTVTVAPLVETAADAVT